MHYRNLHIIGSSHIARQSLNEVRAHIENEKPDIVALELDPRRLYGLLHDAKGSFPIWKIGIKGYLFSVIGSWASKKLGKLVGVAPGSEMKTAYRLARKNNLKVALIDQDIEITLKRFSAELTWREKWNFVADLIRGLFFRDKVMEGLGIKGLDLRKVPDKEMIRKLIGQLKVRFPNVHKVLIDERNRVMAANLSRIMAAHPDSRILAVVGAGHEEDIISLLKARFGYSFSVEYEDTDHLVQ
ncbi:MAG: TraB/GumN family protein [archaeon]